MAGAYWDHRTCSWQGDAVPGPPPVWIPAHEARAARADDTGRSPVPAQPTAADANAAQSAVPTT